MKQMDDKYRDPLDLRMMGYSIQEIAEILEITPQNAKVRLHRARQMILKEMEAQDESAGNREIRISPDALIALVVAEAEDRELSAHAESGRDERGLPSFGRISEEDGQAAPSRPNGNRNVKVPGALQSGCSWWPRRS